MRIMTKIQKGKISISDLSEEEKEILKKEIYLEEEKEKRNLRGDRRSYRGRVFRVILHNTDRREFRKQDKEYEERMQGNYHLKDDIYENFLKKMAKKYNKPEDYFYFF